jgi:hypothetical protein
MKVALYMLFALKLLPEREYSWGGTWSPLQGITEFLAWRGLKFPLVDLLFLLILFASRDRAPQRRAREMEKAIWVSCCAMMISFLWGIIHGGSVYQVQFQLYSYVFSFMFAFTVAKLLVTPEDFLTLGKVFFGVTVYRACTCISAYVAAVRDTGLPPFVATSHEDSVIFVTGIVMATAYLIEKRGKVKVRTGVALAVGIVLLLLAIQFNNRRLAWVSLCASLGVTYFLIPPSPLKKKINRRLLIVSPIIVLYIAVGTGRPERVFAPLRALSSVKSEDDSSTRSRDVENLGLLVTLVPNSLMGTGWGIEYNEVDNRYSAYMAKGFAQYRYMPHNSLLAFVAFTGGLGFAATWMVFPVSVFLNARTYIIGRSPPIRMAAMVSVGEAIIVANQGWGDLGLFAQIPMMVASLAFATAIRLPAAVRREQSQMPTSRAT